VLRRGASERMPPVEPITKEFVADWRQLRRFGLDESRLPPGTQLLYREPTAWERYRAFVLLAIGVVVAELLLIGSLLVERRRRKRAQKAAEEQQQLADDSRRVVAHMGRITLLGELATTISHELRQPLAAILTNAQAGSRAVRSRGALGAEDRELFDEIFRAIAEDDALASGILSRVRALVRSEASPDQLVDLNEVCRAAARLLQYDALTRHVDMSLSLDPELRGVIGDPVQFQQIVLNIMLNALEACAGSAAPRIEVTTIGHDEEIEVAVRDNGPGLSEGVRLHLFESFFTTKPQGLGVGLAIVHSIIERHHGRILAENGEEGGAVFRVMLPCARIARSSPRGTQWMHFGTESSVSH
jgi:signal transduction histidine kinase